ncbi:MAG TPA: riboflavin synthase [Hanamia sp.]|nr:riboflavin synthase [Hanamia sp.]
MFTGIIRNLGELVEISSNGSNRTFYIESGLAEELKIDESVAHNGVCLTVEDIDDHIYRITAIEETLKKSNAGYWEVGDLINLEQSMQLNDRLDGHIVQGHVDGTGICKTKKEKNGSFEFTFAFDKKFAPLMIEKGSVCVNGVSLTAFNVSKDRFTVAIIPYTFANTNLKNLQEKDIVNLEFDILGKYVQRMLQVKAAE